MSQDRLFRIAIVGGGIGGLVCALFLDWHVQHPIQIDVYNLAAQYREIGAGVGIGPNAAKLIHEAGLGNCIDALSGDCNGVWISFRRFDNGNEFITIPSVETKKARSTSMTRSEFLDLLIAAIRERNATTLHTNKRCIQVSKTNSDTAMLNFADETTSTANLVISCDGIHSAVRGTFASDKPVYGGMIAYRGVIPIASLPAWKFPSYSVLWMGKGRHFLVFPISTSQSLNIVAFVSKSEAEVEDTTGSWTAPCGRKEVEQDF